MSSDPMESHGKGSVWLAGHGNLRESKVFVTTSRTCVWLPRAVIEGARHESSVTRDIPERELRESVLQSRSMSHLLFCSVLTCLLARMREGEGDRTPPLPLRAEPQCEDS